METLSSRLHSEIAKNYNDIVRQLIVMLERKTRSEIEAANLDRLKQRIALLCSTCGHEALIRETGKFLLKHSEQLLARDENFLRQMTFNTVKKENEFMLSLFESAKKYYDSAKQYERDDVYNKVVTLHNVYIEYLLASENDNQSRK